MPTDNRKVPSRDEARSNALPRIVSYAQDYLRKGFSPIPVELRGKAGIGRWDKLAINNENVAHHFGQHQNIGLLLGERSGGLTDVDLDCVEAISAAPAFLPSTSMISGRKTKPSSHWFYRSTLHTSAGVASIQYKDLDGSVLCELRIGGGAAAAQTVVPPSTHPSGERIVWYKEGSPADVEDDVLRSAVVKCASASLLAKHWPTEGGRHHAALALDGFLTRANWSAEDRQHFIEIVATIAGDDDPRDRKRTSQRTEAKLKQGGKISGLPKMIEHFGEDLVRRLAQWIEYPGWDTEEPLERMNAEYAVVMDGGKTRILRFDPQIQTRGDGRVVHRRLVPDFLTFGDFYNYHLDEQAWTVDKAGNKKTVSLGVWWARHPKRRKYAGVTFRPNAEEVIDGRLNLWRGWGVPPAQGDWSLLKEHIEQILASRDKEAAAYIENWLAWAVQNPADRAQVALVFKGGRGTGKGTLGNAMCHLFGQHATHISSAEHVSGRFNAHLRDAVFLFADEAYWPGDKAGEGALKRLITEPTLFIEAKGRDGVTVPNMLHVMMASNEKWVVPAGEHERRYAVFQVSEEKRQDQCWFEPIYKQLEDGGYAAMLHDLLHRELGEWHPRQIPMTDALREQQLQSLEPLDAWLVELFEEGQLPEGEGVTHADIALSHSRPDLEGRNPKTGLYDVARERYPKLRHLDDQVLAAHLKRWGCKPWRNNQARGWRFPPLAECRRRWEEKYPGWPWQHPDLTEWQSHNVSPLFDGPRPPY